MRATAYCSRYLPHHVVESRLCHYLGIGDGSLEAKSQPVDTLAVFLSRILKRKVLNKTGLVGDFDVDLKWTPDLSTGANTAPDGGPSIFTAIEEQLGLKLESGRAPLDVLVIDHIDHASEN